jgi:TonB-linked SusC/RagA family outer membrane protein
MNFKQFIRTHSRAVKKSLLIMKLTMIILITGCLQLAAAASKAQKVTLVEKNARIENIIKKIEQQTGYHFLYKKEWLNNVGTQNLNLNNVTLQNALDQVFKGLSISYTISEETIVLRRSDVLPPKKEITDADVASVYGSVLDRVGKPMVGASVSMTGQKSFHVLTDDYGVFSMGLVPVGKYKLTVTYVGYETQQQIVEINKGDYERKFSIFLYEADSKLDQVQVIAYGRESRRFSVGSIATLSSADIEKQPVTNVLQALQGRIAGFNVTSTNGLPSAQTKLQVRGQNTVASSLNQNAPYDQPLIIIDGVPFATQNDNINQLQSLGMGMYNASSILSGVSPFMGINPKDIESISVLKDADATSIYGSQGSNGVILITTKKGKTGKTVADVVVNSGVSIVTVPVKLMNTQQYTQLRKDALTLDGITPSDDPNDFGYAPDLTIFDQHKYTDWQKTIFGQTAKNTDVHVNLSGGSNSTTFLVSGGYSVNDYNIPGHFSNKRGTFHSNVSHTSNNRRFSVSFGSDFAYSQNNSASFGAFDKVLLPPNLPDLLDANGNLIWDYKGVILNGYQFYSSLKQPNILQNYNLNNTLHLDYQLVEGLNVSANLGYNRNNTNENQQVPVSSMFPQPGNISNANFSHSTVQAINIEPQLDYHRGIGKGELSVLAGGTYKKNVQNTELLSGTGYSNDALLGSINGASTIIASDGYKIYKYAAVFGRIKYLYDQKYIVSLTGRRDGSSNFGPGRQFGNFGSVGLGWIFSEEAAFKQVVPFVSYAKLSANYGTSGSDGIAPYQFQAFWQPDAYAPLFQGQRPYYPVNLYNPNYNWASKKSLNVALDFGLFNNKLLVNANYYRNREGNQLVNYSLPTQAGFYSVLENLGAIVQNTGWEFSATSTNIKTKNFTWTSSFNISTNRNKLVAFPGLESSSYASYYQVGLPTSTVMGFKYKGVNPETGIFEVYNAKGEATSSPNSLPVSLGGDQVPIANLAPKFFGGLGNDLNYKGFSLSVFFQFSKQTAPNYLHKLYSFGNLPGGGTNVPVELAGKYWTKPGDIATFQRPTSYFYSSAGLAGGQAFIQSSATYGDDTYLRLKTLTFSYTLPETYTKKLGISNFRIYLSGQNVLTFTNYKVGDPEQPGGFGDNFPMQRTLVGGISFNL